MRNILRRRGATRRCALAAIAGAALTTRASPRTVQAAPADLPILDRDLVSDDGTRLHFLECGVGRHCLLFVPGWLMPGWIWSAQLRTFGRSYRALALDPRGQGGSEIAPAGYTPQRRGLDIGNLVQRVGAEPVVLVGWSLGVLDVLAYLREAGDRDVAGLVLVDSSVGVEPLPVSPRRVSGPLVSREADVSRFVKGLFNTPQRPGFLQHLTIDALRTPAWASLALRHYPEPPAYWRQAVEATGKPLLYVVRPPLAAQAENLRRSRANVEVAVFEHAGHALFVDEAPRFNALVDSFIQRRVWPR